MKKILITGGAGFIGSNFCNNFSVFEGSSDYKLLILDALTYAGRKSNLLPSLSRGAEFIQGDIRDKELVAQIFRSEQLSGVIHFAAESHVDRSIFGPDIFVETNVNGTLNLLNASLATWQARSDFRFLQVSTDEVYGSLKTGEPAFTEETPLAANSPYSASKAAADLFVRSFHETYGLPTLTTRCSNNYGPFQFREKLIPLMITNALKEQALPVYGDGSNIRDWIHVDDHNRGVWQVFSQGVPGQVYNLGGACEKSNLEIVSKILSLLGKSPSLIRFVKDRPGHDFRYAMNYSKAEKQLGWRPLIGFEDGLKATIQWYLSNPGWPH